MAATMKNAESDVHVTFEDQQKINKFARHNAKLQDLKDEVTLEKKLLQNLEDALDELLLLEDNEKPIPYQIGEVFLQLSIDAANNKLEEDKKKAELSISKLEQECEIHKGVLSDLKVQLYAKFGNNINLEAEEE
ncbi:prefoldin subunit 4-like [Argonauta hians]